MKLSDVKDGISVCISRITNSFAEVYGSSDLTVRIKEGAYFIDDTAEPEPEELAAEQENDSDDEEGEDGVFWGVQCVLLFAHTHRMWNVFSDFASEGASDDEVASEDLLCEEELSASDEEEEDSDLE